MYILIFLEKGIVFCIFVHFFGDFGDCSVYIAQHCPTLPNTGRPTVTVPTVRSRSATRSPTATTSYSSISSRLYSSTVASRAKQITPILTDLAPGRKSSRSSPR